ncbi:glycosyltransferase [Algoriphagus lacus]|uniref:Glycosyltransferase n=1 Tax=Algoriphagus lacus TaxID=2056311 RepID=A0A418PLS5_9BACT|nr:glycosyltransferase family 4 protein [Algoriphagus lacus]RIW12250.1 glycosyltransferase [Algoriphagus lacus]
MSKDNLKILQLIDTLDTGGAERMAVNMANAFFEAGISNLLVVSRSNGKLHHLVNNKSSLRLLGKRNTLDFKAFKSLISILDEFNPDILHAHGTSVYWGVGIKFLRPGVKLIWHDHLGISEEVIQKNPRNELSWIGSKIDFVLTANESTKSYWEQKKLVKSERIAFLANFPSLSKVEKNKPSIFTFLHLANFRSEKGQVNLIKAAGILDKKGLDFRVRLIGKEVDSIWKKRVLELRKELELEEKVSVEDSVMDVSNVLSEVHSGIVASDREGLPVALLEYGLADLAVISTQVGQCPEVLGHGEFGKLVPSENPESLALEMERFITNPQDALKLGEDFGKHVSKNYGSAQFLSGYVKLVDELFNLKKSEN